jgi:ABC-type nitrate/sulfonate/bicarbonate transport system permease component
MTIPEASKSTAPVRHALSRVRNEALAPAAVLLAILAVWETATGILHIKAYILPAPSQILAQLWSNWPVLFSNLQVTVVEMLVGFALASLVGTSVGILLATSTLFRRGVYPLVIASQTIPVIAIAPVLVIWFGYNIVPRVLVTALIAFFPLTVNTVAGFTSVDPELVRFFRALNATPFQIFRKLAVPSALPYVFAGLKVAATLSVIGATVGEWVGSDQGLGQLILSDTSLLNTPRVFASILLLSLSGITLFLLVAAVEWFALPWRHRVRARSVLPWLRPRRSDGTTVFDTQVNVTRKEPRP